MNNDKISDAAKQNLVDEQPDCSALSEIKGANVAWVVQRLIWKKGYLARLLCEEADRLEACYEIGKGGSYIKKAAQYRAAANALSPRILVPVQKNESISDTPRTDERARHSMDDSVDADFARELEREVAKWKNISSHSQ